MSSFYIVRFSVIFSHLVLLGRDVIFYLKVG